MSEQSPKRAPRATRAPKTPVVAPEAAAATPSVESARRSSTDAAPKRKTTTAKVNGVSTPAAAAKAAAAAKPTAPKATPRKKSAAAAPTATPVAKKAAPKAPPKTAKKVPAVRLGAGRAPGPCRSRGLGAGVIARGASPAVPSATQGASLSVLLVSSEAVPFARTGDLADLVGGAATALGSLGHRVTLVVPKYAGRRDARAPVDRFAVASGPAPKTRRATRCRSG